MNNSMNTPAPEIKKEPLPEIKRRDYIFLGIFLVLSMLASMLTCGAGLEAGFAIAAGSLLSCALIYLRGKMKFDTLSWLSLIASFVIITSFFVHDTTEFSFYKFVFLLISISVFFISACGFSKSRLDRFGIVFSPLFLIFNVSIANVPKTARATVNKRSGIFSKFSQVFVALICVVPLAAVLIFLLMSADAAFENFIDSLKLGTGDFINYLFWGLIYFVIIFSFVFSVSKKLYKDEEKKSAAEYTLDSIFVNTILFVITVIYLTFIVTQLSYFFSGFAGLLPRNFTYAQYARRGFFEMCVICIINLIILAVAHYAVKRDESKLPVGTRILSVFISGFSLLLIVTALAKMFMYIKSFGLSFLRLGTSIFMVFLFVVFIAMIIKVFKDSFLHVRVMIGAACIIMAITAIIEPHAVISAYNTYAYESGMHQTIDIYYLHYDCGDYATASLIKLAESEKNIIVANEAKNFLSQRHSENYGDTRYKDTLGGFTLSEWIAENKLDEYFTK